MPARHLAAVVDNLGDGVIVLDAAGRLGYANVAAARLLGFATPADLLAASPAEVAARCAVFDATGAAVAGTGLPDAHPPDGRDGEEVLRRLRVAATGAERWVAVRGTALVAADGTDLVLNIYRDVTDRVQAEAALDASRRLADRVGAASPDILYVFDVIDSRTVYVNDAIGRVLGYPPEHLTGTEDADPMAMRHPDDRATLQAAVARVAAAADGEVVEFAFRMRHADGSWRWLAARVTVLSREPDGRPRLVVGAALDVTALRETEAALRESEARYRAVVDSQTEMICRYSPGTATITFVNDAYCRSFRRTREELLGRSILDLAPESSHERLSAYFQSLVANPHPAEIEHEIDLPDGTVGWQHWVDYPVYDAAGTVVEFQGIGRDVTELRRAEATLRASEAHLRLALENAAMGTWDWQVNAGRVAWSEHTGPLFGLPAGTPGLSDEEYYGLIHPDDRERLREIDRRRVADGRAYAAEFRVVWPDGTVRWMESKCRAVAHDERGRVTRFLGVMTDVTERKRADESLRELSGRLLTMQDEERRRLARELHEQTAQLLVALSLDLATARRRLTATADLATDRLLDEAETLGQQALREVRTVSYLLHPPSLDAAGLAPTLREYAEGFGRRSGVRVDLSGVRDVGRLPADAESALLRVAQEALLNVARHAEVDRATLALWTRPGAVVLRVADQGRGMAGIESPGDAAPLGVGIAGMRARLRQLGGELDIVSDPGSGTAVTAWLPVGTRTRADRRRAPNRRCVAPAGNSDRA